MEPLPAQELEEMIIKVAKIIREEREQRKLDSDATLDNRLIKLPAHKRAVFVGDLHGELDSLNEILQLTNFADEEVESDVRGYIVFLGDYVDRGSNSIETLVNLLDLKTRFRENVILLKGNHELPSVNSRYGFFDEVMKKYPHEGNEIYTVCNRLFEKFPHAVISANGIFAAHGGIPEKVSTLLQIANLDDNGLEQLLWNDPRPEILGFEPNFDRDPSGLTGIRIFGEDVTERFLKAVGAKVLLRAHENLGGTGYLVFSNRVLSIFSARYGRAGWKRAYLETDLSKEVKDTSSLVQDIRIF
jgi:diadenosine tetraphosphatase ApaH/serine/threonine PP2A family protein phosphatase